LAGKIKLENVSGQAGQIVIIELIEIKIKKVRITPAPFLFCRFVIPTLSPAEGEGRRKKEEGKTTHAFRVCANAISWSPGTSKSLFRNILHINPLN
jgi:hypothetical protein